MDCIHPKQDEADFETAPHLYVNPIDCIDCGACVPVCPTNSVFSLDDLPAESARFAEINAAHYNCPSGKSSASRIGAMSFCEPRS